jgi:uncharacterized membrane protein
MDQPAEKAPARNHQELLGPAVGYRRRHPPVRNVNVEYDKKSSFGQRLADGVAGTVGSWPFIATQSVFLLAWIVVNVYLVVMATIHPGFLKAWDPYPFILLNLLLSFQAAYTGPVVMMSQNRQAQKDRLEAEHDFEINRRAEEEVEVIIRELVHQDRLLSENAKRLETLAGGSAPDIARTLDQILERITEQETRITALVQRLGDAGP